MWRDEKVLILYIYLSPASSEKLGSSYSRCPEEMFFHTDYRPLLRFRALRPLLVTDHLNTPNVGTQPIMWLTNRPSLPHTSFLPPFWSTSRATRTPPTSSGWCQAENTWTTRRRLFQKLRNRKRDLFQSRGDLLTQCHSQPPPRPPTSTT